MRPVFVLQSRFCPIRLLPNHTVFASCLTSILTYLLQAHQVLAHIASKINFKYKTYLRFSYDNVALLCDDAV